MLDAAQPPALALRSATQRDLVEIVVELAVCVHKRGMYPPTHPILAGAVEAVHARCAQHLATHGPISLGIANRTLFIDGVQADGDHPLLRDLAHRLHEHALGAVGFDPSITRLELEEWIAAVSESTLRTGEPLGLRPAGERDRWPHITVHPVAFERLALLDEGGRAAGESELASVTTLWLALSRASMGQGWSDEAPLDPRLMAQAIEQRRLHGQSDEFVADCLMQLLDQMRTTTGQAAEGIRQNMSALVEGLSDETLSRLMSLGTDADGGRSFLREAIESLRARAVVDLARAAAAGNGTPISHGMLRLLSKMADGAERSDRSSREADMALRLTVKRLLSGWSLATPNPESYDGALQALSVSKQRPITDRFRDRVEPERSVELALELGQAHDGVASWRRGMRSRTWKESP